MDIKNYLSDALEKLNIEISHTQLSQFERYFNLLVEWNSKINLTRITQPEEVAVKHFADSLTLLKYVDVKTNARLVDVGTGAGFPGIPIKIMRPDINLTLLDSLNKRLVFLEEVCNSIGIDAEFVHTRAEQGGADGDFREKFDVVTSRAVARLNTLSEYCIPYVKTGGTFVAMKGPELQEELKESQNAVKVLGGEVENVWEFSLPDDSRRTIVAIKKISHTPKQYPRQGTKIKNKPL
ncbi:MAG: 16S rRNA (guanine(527)-N(7))-methyltransferase RsmG [Oscillospiraceae bacterium]|nr:16S rRNA (guanine(527)-N(7))-methyltransferase RsmG [Oscillospiraceae bacterium]